MTSELRVIKLGGSLLNCPDLGKRFLNWRAAQRSMFDLVIVGGGRYADALRAYDTIHSWSTEVTHRLAIDAMSLSAQTLRQLLPEAKLVADSSLLDAHGDSALVIFDVRQFMADEEPSVPGTRLHASWDVTSDSIAARVAEVRGAAELVLLKSTLRSDLSSLTEWANAGLVDAFFPQAAVKLPRVRLVNLRDGCFAEQCAAG